ncbi:MAG: DUF6491 family protein [Xanthomonadales bacterium]|nr:DUF6491 family protein [Xanthomonadales bacterium]
MRAIAILAAAALSAACSGHQLRRTEAETYLALAGEPVEEVRAFRLTGWRPLDREHLVLWRSANDAFLIRVQQPCIHLEFAHRIGVDYQAPVLRRRFDAVIVQGQRCRIESIRPLDDRVVRRALRDVRG